jgi:hypothetical protein
VLHVNLRLAGTYARVGAVIGAFVGGARNLASDDSPASQQRLLGFGCPSPPTCVAHAANAFDLLADERREQGVIDCLRRASPTYRVKLDLVEHCCHLNVRDKQLAHDWRCAGKFSAEMRNDCQQAGPGLLFAR